MTQSPQAFWFPDDVTVREANLSKLMQELGVSSYKELHKWSVDNYQDYWSYIINALNIDFSKPYTSLVDLSYGVTNPKWLVDARLNIAKSCFKAHANDIAIVSADEDGNNRSITYQELDVFSNQIAMSFLQLFPKGCRTAVIMPMNIEAIAIYLGIIKAGSIAISIAESFSQTEITARIDLAKVDLVFTKDEILRAGKRIALYDRVSANCKIVVIRENLKTVIKNKDLDWKEFLLGKSAFTVCDCNPQDYINILFSSGTTGNPKLIPWDHTTPIKCAADAYFHLNVKPNDILCWPTSLGWMMGPWLIFASLINKACIALYDGVPNSSGFAEFVQNQKVNILGLVPSLLKSWRQAKILEGLDLSNIKVFASTGECSNIGDMQYLMSLNNKPVIEYCGGTEVGGAYVTSTVIEAVAPSAFTTPAMGLDFVILNDEGDESNRGEVALMPPSIGLSNKLLNKEHYQEYYADMPKSKTGKILRRHGDAIRLYPNGFYMLLGRADDTMNLGGIKVSSVEIEKVINTLSCVAESAAIGITPEDGGPSNLVIYVVVKQNGFDNNLENLKKLMQDKIKNELNPLFKIFDVVILDALPRTVSNKIIRKALREMYCKS